MTTPLPFTCSIFRPVPVRSGLLRRRCRRCRLCRVVVVAAAAAAGGKVSQKRPPVKCRVGVRFSFPKFVVSLAGTRSSPRKETYLSTSRVGRFAEHEFFLDNSIDRWINRTCERNVCQRFVAAKKEGITSQSRDLKN